MSSGVKALIFTKDRPLQCEALIESLRHYTQIDPFDVHVLYPNQFELYRPTVRSSSGVHWHGEDGSFDAALRALFSTRGPFDIDTDAVLLLVDDCFFFRDTSLRSAAGCLRDNRSVLSFSMRLGRNIRRGPSMVHGSKVSFWRWAAASWHWGYPFSISCDLHRVSLVREVLASRDTFTIPNDLESAGVLYCFKNRVPTFNAMFNGHSVAACLDANRVQDFHPNAFHGGPEVSAQNLISAYQQGQRLDWRSYEGITPGDCFIGHLGVRLVWPAA